jgi:Phytanoyl-CoA dioxygenase (PhyH)
MAGESPDEGLALVRSALGEARISALSARIDRRYDALDAARRAGGIAAMERLVAPPHRFAVTASSLSLGAVLAGDEIAALLAEIMAGPVGPALRAIHLAAMVCDIDQAWVRRQYAPAHYPPLHAPHGWHQDGGLAHAFDGAEGEGDAPPLAMTTCWIALVACGVEAPGLEFVSERRERLLLPSELPDDQLRRVFPPPTFWHPTLDPGDALLFSGDLLHRTYVTPAMTRDRTSIELRFFPANGIPGRLAGDRFVPSQ